MCEFGIGQTHSAVKTDSYTALYNNIVPFVGGYSHLGNGDSVYYTFSDPYYVFIYIYMYSTYEAAMSRPPPPPATTGETLPLELFLFIFIAFIIYIIIILFASCSPLVHSPQSFESSPNEKYSYRRHFFNHRRTSCEQEYSSFAIFNPFYLFRFFVITNVVLSSGAR